VKAMWEKFANWYDHRVLREQIIFACIVLILVYAIVDFAILQGLGNEKKALQTRFDMAEKELGALETQKKVLIDGLQNNPGIAKQREVAQLKERVSQLENDIQEVSAGLVSAEDLPKVIRDILLKSDRLKLLGLVANAPQELVLQAEAINSQIQGEGQQRNEVANDEAQQESVGVFKHSVVFRLEGRYRDIHEYLSTLESSDWQFYWDEFQYEVTDFPLAVAQITAYTLSTEAGFIDE